MLFRSWMFVPGNNERRIEKLKDLNADVVIYDLEDAVSLNEKEKAREMVRYALNQYENRISFVRVNDLLSPFFADDLKAVVTEGLYGIMLPKASKAKDILEADTQITELEQKNGLAAGSIEIVPLIENAQGVYLAYDIAISSDRVRRLAFGSVDYTLDIHAELSKEGTEILFARSQLVVHSKAAGKESPVDAVYIHIKDQDGLLRDAKLAKQLGFQGKLVVHPDQIAVVNGVFSPSQEEIVEAQAIVTAFDEALRSGMAAIQVGGKMIDYPVAARARKILEKAKQLGNIS
ncbi:CoA ester lyase [Paenibacillus frigoriresistens]|uniref:HpcH/HpaI aldolase/citrate lyase family protein n=1 Tax=Paenibacillus alginolyticus TaxID=59839 RepID=UPI00156555C5|nr:CoA ester lyase [Paenibacillus frigoriresistens]NRF94372.1 CoA ester lyase [Paenibacillus frigoriresistens]